MRLIVKFTLIILLASSLHIYAQQAEVKKAPPPMAALPDTSYEWIRGARLGCNIAPFILTSFQSGRKGFEFSIDTRLTPKLYPVFELGFENNQYSKDYITYHSNGGYGRLGIDCNLRKADPKSRDMFFIGGRYGFYAMQHRTDSYSLTDTIWGQNTTASLSPTSSYGHWIEIVSGVRVEILHNIFLGWSMRGKFLIARRYAENYPQYMPGFGNGANSVNFGFTYSVFYEIPLMKVRSKLKVKVVEEEEEPEETPKNQIQDSQMQK